MSLTEAISAATMVALNSESNDQELSLLREFFDTAVRYIPDKSKKDFVLDLIKSVDNELPSTPYDMQVKYLELLKSSV